MKKRIAWTFACALGLAGAAGAESLYREQSYRPLVSDNKAHRVGDALTVLVMENATAASSADNTADRRQGLGIDFTDTLHVNRSVRVQTNNDFDGRGVTQRSGRLLAQIAVTVVGVEPNGELRIQGDQLLEINREQQKIRLEGRVRPQDVTDSNTIASTRIAEARISYIGDGDVSLRARPSWWHNFLTWIGL
ncbi:MAG TPA: flagellar basal body L-ring protein FlgH [Usitatibacter sp.]|nr:flagellar basal body L-ring protein FlgH [Usitatibacter sp.]